MALPEPLIFLLPIVATLLSGWLRSDGLPVWANKVICLVVVLLCSTLWALLSNKLVSDLAADVFIIAGGCVALMSSESPLSSLHQWLTVNVASPEWFVALLASQRNALATPVTLRASLPRRESSLTQRSDIIDADAISAQPTRPMPPAMPEPAQPDAPAAPTETQREQGS